MRPEADIRHVHELVKVERFSPAHKPVVKSEVKIKKSFEKCFWITTDKYLSESQHIHELFPFGTIVSKFQIAFGFTARPPPVSLT
jgi:hypothetical protein